MIAHIISVIGDLIARYELLSGLGVTAVVGTSAYLARRFSRARQARRPPRLYQLQPLDVEVIPVRFQVDLVQRIPEVMIWLRVVNYLPKELQLSDVTVTYLHPDEGQSLEGIPGGEFRIASRQSWEVMCRRRLQDLEVEPLKGMRWKDGFEAHLHVRVRGTGGKKAISLDLTGLRIHGRIVGLPSQPKPAV